MDWSPDGSMIASTSWDGWVRLWDSKTGEHIKAIRGPVMPEKYKFTFARFLPDGRVFAHGNQGLLRTQHISKIPTEDRQDVTLPGAQWTFDATPDGRRMICGAYSQRSNRRELMIVDAELSSTWTSSRELDGPLRAVVLSPKGRYALILENDGGVELWNLDEDVSVQEFDDIDTSVFPGSLAMSLDGRLGATAGTDGLKVFRLPREVWGQ